MINKLQNCSLYRCLSIKKKNSSNNFVHNHLKKKNLKIYKKKKAFSLLTNFIYDGFKRCLNKISWLFVVIR